MRSPSRIDGIPKLMRRLDKMDRAYGGRGEKLQNVIIRGAKITQANIRVEAPYKTGALKRGILAEELPKIKNRPMAVVKANYSRSKGPTAPHAHLVENGHITPSGSHTAANPFFERGVQRSKGVVRRMTENEMGKLMNKAARK